MPKKKTEKPRSLTQESVARREKKDRAGLRGVRKLDQAEVDKIESGLRRAEVGLDL